MFEDLDLIASFCNEQGRHSGCALFAKNALKCKVGKNFAIFSSQNVIECCSFQFNFVNWTKFVIIRDYIPWTLILDTLSNEKDTKYVILNHFNVNILDFDNEHS